MLCPADTPEGESCGLVKNLALLAHVTIGELLIEQIARPLSDSTLCFLVTSAQSLGGVLHCKYVCSPCFVLTACCMRAVLLCACRSCYACVPSPTASADEDADPITRLCMDLGVEDVQALSGAEINAEQTHLVFMNGW